MEETTLGKSPSTELAFSLQDAGVRDGFSRNIYFQPGQREGPTMN